MRPIKTILHYGDLHCGSTSGLWHPDVPKGEGGTTGIRGFNFNQKAMWKVWTDEVNRWLPERWPDGFDIAINLNDSIDGKQPKQEGIGVETADLRAQCYAAIECQKMLKGMVKDLYILEGTPYHVGDDYLSSEFMAMALSETFNIIPNDRTGKLTHRHLFLTVGGIRFMYKHELSYFQIYKSTPLERELQRALRKEAMQYAKERDVLGFGHVHTQRTVSFPVGDELKAAFTIPCHQVESSHATKKSLFNTLANFGMLVVEVYGKDRTPPFAVIPLTYPVKIRSPKEYIHV